MHVPQILHLQAETLLHCCIGLHSAKPKQAISSSDLKRSGISCKPQHPYAMLFLPGQYEAPSGRAWSCITAGINYVGLTANAVLGLKPRTPFRIRNRHILRCNSDTQALAVFYNTARLAESLPAPVG